ncbi:MAG: GHKL domain-containing protein [Clostridiales Family XIII bacterium]|jgi:signal transduction histidine kinase|nr:GHKL domain-containing protein [Clostridiales Family XIII bacterium]
MPVYINFFASLIESITVYGILILLDRDNSMPVYKIIIYAIASGFTVTLLEYVGVSYHFIFTFPMYIILLKILLKKKIVLLLMDVVIAGGCYMLLQFITSILIKNIHGDILENYYILFSMLILFAGVTWLLIRNNKISSRIEGFYVKNRDIVAWNAVSLFLTILIISHLWYNAESFFWKEQWMLLALVLANYSLNIALLVSFLRRKQQKNKVQAYQEYGEYLEEMMHQLSGRQHEFANQINTMVGLAQVKNKDELASAIIEYGERILGEKKRTGKSIISDDSMLTAMLYQKRAQAERQDIPFECLIEEAFQKSLVSPYDLVELIVNLINNAFEAVMTLPADEREVFLKINRNSIEVINTVSKGFDHAAVIKLSQLGYSTKGKNRGYGLSNIKAIVERYNGKLDIYMQDDMIIFSILFP